ncbi:unnamed protein product [marine sediment metagenome]|uniref:Uncharacterized protein n=1 Tax=marine sediment metagenome TaxID=412755 RepID=X0V1Q1_9ZZZZ
MDLRGREMPAALERELKETARKKGLSKKRAGAYVYGTLRKTGWKPKKKRSLISQAIRS